MSLRPEPIGPIPEETSRVARRRAGAAGLADSGHTGDQPQAAGSPACAGQPQRGIAAASIRLQEIFRRTSLHQLPLVEQAMGQQALALLLQLNAAAQAEHELAEATRVAFQQHRDSAIFTTFPGLGELPSARLLK